MATLAGSLIKHPDGNILIEAKQDIKGNDSSFNNTFLNPCQVKKY